MEKLQTGNVWKKQIIFFVFCMIFMAFPLCAGTGDRTKSGNLWIEQQE